MVSLAFIPNLGFTEILIICAVLLLIFGPKALPKLGRSLGDGIRELRNATRSRDEADPEEPAEMRPKGALPMPPPPAEPPPSVKKDSERIS